MKIKRAVCAVLVLAILFLSAALPAAAKKKEHCDVDPVIILQGYSGTQLFENLGTDNEKRVWYFDNDEMMQLIKSKLPQLIFGVFMMLLGSDDYLVDVLGTNAVAFLEKISMNDDGTSKYDLSPYPTDVKRVSAAALRESGEENYIGEPLVSEEIMKYVPADHYFTFCCDWRYGQVKNAAKLQEFIEEVLEYTGHSKVDIYALSHGGQLGATYLYYYGEQALVDNIVLNIPAIRGTSLVSEAMEGNVNVDFSNIVEFAEIGARNELSLEFLLNLVPQAAINEMFADLAQKHLLPFIKNFGSVWDFVLPEKYDELKEKYLDPIKNAGIIAASDEMHYNCMAHMEEGLKRAQAAGVDIAIMSNTGLPIVTGKNVNTDYIVDVASSSGAFCSPLGESFKEDYVQKNTSCNTPGHDHVSPSFNIDASTCYLPDNTWFTQRQYHGQVWWDNYTRALYMKLLLTDDLKDVYSDPDFPQFEIAQNPKDKIYAKFEGCVSGHVSEDSKYLEITNLSDEYSVSLTRVSAGGAFSKTRFSFNPLVMIKPGETVKVAVFGSFSKRMSVKIDFVQYKIHPVFCNRTVDFKLG